MFSDELSLVDSGVCLAVRSRISQAHIRTAQQTYWTTIKNVAFERKTFEFHKRFTIIKVEKITLKRSGALFSTDLVQRISVVADYWKLVYDGS